MLKQILLVALLGFMGIVLFVFVQAVFFDGGLEHASFNRDAITTKR